MPFTLLQVDKPLKRFWKHYYYKVHNSSNSYLFLIFGLTNYKEAHYQIAEKGRWEQIVVGGAIN